LQVRASERRWLINLFALAIRNGLPAEQIKQTIFAYPTGASDIGYML